MSRSPETAARRRLGAGAFVLLQLAVVALAAAGLGWRARVLEAAHALPTPRPAPLAVTPLYDDPEVVSDQELARVLSRVVLRRRGPATHVGHVDHALRLWGTEARFDAPQVLSGADMAAILTDHRQFVLTFGTERDPLLIDDGEAVRVRAFEGPASSTHLDHTLASLAEVGVGLDWPVVTPLRHTTAAELLEGSLATFGLNQHEVEWSGLLYTLYLPPGSPWRTFEGQEVTFDALARRLMREELTEGVCSAHHRFHALVAMLRVDDRTADLGEPRLLGPDRRRQVVEFLAAVTALLVEHQHPLGFWNDDWSFAAPDSAEPTARQGDELRHRLIVTGHALEWWALAPTEVQPPRATVRAAARWLVDTIDGLSDEQITHDQLTYLTHAARALALWRGRWPPRPAAVETAEPALGENPH